MQRAATPYSLRLTLRCPLVALGQGPQRAFDTFRGELVRDDVVCAAADVYAVRLDSRDAAYARAAASLGSEYLTRVCGEALTGEGYVQDQIADCFWHPVTDVYVIDGITTSFAAAERPVLLGLFVQTIWAALARDGGLLFLDVPATELPFWRYLMGADLQSGFVVAASEYLLRSDDSPRPAQLTEPTARPASQWRAAASRN
ncbi:hypothetical protein [Nannocystis bainbridge]|uniref:Uncharacterized protein n=1 Tax=Nannocystis bainbridge TaxID=2995303 RepID=A0ABT5EDP3_9BACT|nr:hypothetical protein [Nannocystis bainbridge]MDC0723675.1 hypothetical protein [Nannocystis bainbridge]